MASEIGAEQLGMYGIITSVGAVFATVAISGVRFSVTRLTAEEMSCHEAYPQKLMRSAFLYATIFGTVSCIGMYFSAEPLSVAYIADERATVPIRIMAAAMPAIALAAVVEGYFTARQKILRLILTQLFSQLSRMAFAIVGLETLLKKGAYPADILAGSFFVGETVFALGMMFLCILDRSRTAEKRKSGRGMKALVKTALPLAVSAYMRTGLSSVGQVVIPSGLKKSGMTGHGALATYGTITQMALPAIMFPMALLQAMGDMLVPRLTEAQTRGEKLSVSYIVSRSLRLSMIFCAMVMGAVLFYARELGELLYKSAEAGLYIKAFAALIPIIYIDAVTDGCLKGLGQQVYSMALNVAEGVLNVVLLVIFLPKGAIGAYIAIMYIKEGLNTYFSLRRLTEVAKVSFDVGVIFSVALCTVGAWLFVGITAVGGTVAKILLYCIFYVLLLYLANSVTRDDIKWSISLFFNNKI